MDKYEPNTTQWKIGDIVLHHADQKHPRMFMVVTGYARDGLCKTLYVDPNRSRRVYKNDLKNLLDITRFGFDGSENADEYERQRLAEFYGRRDLDTMERSK